MTINVGSIEINGITYDNRCLSASYSGAGIEVDSIPWEGTEYNPWDYKYENEEFVLDVLPTQTAEADERMSLSTRIDDLEVAVCELFETLMM